MNESTNEYTKTLFESVGSIIFLSSVGLFFFDVKLIPSVIIILVLVILVSWGVYFSGAKEYEQKYKKNISEIRQKADGDILEATRLMIRAEKEEELWKKTMLERNSGFKTLLSFVSYFEKLRDEPISDYLSEKSHPAYKAADVVREQTKRRREVDFINKRTQAIIEMYEQYAPFLIELKDDIPDVDDVKIFEEYTEEERLDTVIQYLTKEEYRKLPTIERNQMA